MLPLECEEWNVSKDFNWGCLFGRPRANDMSLCPYVPFYYSSSSKWLVLLDTFHDFWSLGFYVCPMVPLSFRVTIIYFGRVCFMVVKSLLLLEPGNVIISLGNARVC